MLQTALSVQNFIRHETPSRTEHELNDKYVHDVLALLTLIFARCHKRSLLIAFMSQESTLWTFRHLPQEFTYYRILLRITLARRVSFMQMWYHSAQSKPHVVYTFRASPSCHEDRNGTYFMAILEVRLLHASLHLFSAHTRYTSRLLFTQ